MRIVLILLVVIVFSKCKEADKKIFTGTIEYAYTYTSDSLNADSIAATRQQKAFFRYDANNYQSQFINPDTTTYYYSGNLNKCLEEKNHDQQYACEDYSKENDVVLSFKVYDTNEKILGHRCKVLEVQKKNALLIYYFSTNMKMAPATYSQHRSYNWDFYGDKSEGGIILKSEIRFKDFTKKGIATEIREYDQDFKALEIDEEKFSEVCK